MRSGAPHLYVHLPFCAHRCGYCDFVTATGRDHLHGAYVDALLRELREEHDGSPVETIFLGGGTPTYHGTARAAAPPARAPAGTELTVEANPETVTPELARALRGAGVNRVSLGAQTFQPHLLRVLERLRDADDVKRAFITCATPDSTTSRSTSSTGFPDRAPPSSKPTSPRRSRSSRSTSAPTSSRRSPARASRIAHGAELERQAERMEDYFERVVAHLTGAGYRWYETANFCRARTSVARAQPRLLARPRLSRPRYRRGLDDRSRALAQHAAARALPAGRTTTARSSCWTRTCGRANA